MGEGLRVRDLRVAYGAVRALKGVDVDVAPGEIVALVGRSGSGKSSLLRAVGGTVTPTGGSVAWDGIDVTRRKPHKRDFGLIVTAPTLFDRYTVSGNVSYGLRSWSRYARNRRVLESLGRFGVAHLRDARVQDLTSGQARRVSLARSLAPSPRLMLLDEPFGAMAGQERAELSALLIAVLREEGIAAIYVTHAVDEAVGSTDRILVLDSGRVAQDGLPPVVRHRPATRSVAEHFGFAPFLVGNVERGTVVTELGVVPSQGRAGQVQVGVGPTGLAVDPRGVKVAVRSERMMAGFVEITVRLPSGKTAHVRTDEKHGAQTIGVALNSDDCVVLPVE